MSKERAASALWHLSVDAVNQVAISKAGGLAPLVQLLDDGTAQAAVFAADALDRLCIDNADNQSSIAKKLVTLLGSRDSGAQQRSAHYLLRACGPSISMVGGGPARPANVRI